VAFRQFPFPAFVTLILLALSSHGTLLANDSLYVRQHYVKREVSVPVRDGVRLFTAIYSPLDTSATYPILMLRTPYGVGPYGADRYRTSLGPSSAALREGFIFVYQDVRGAMMSEGEYVNVRPSVRVKKGFRDVDESTDAYDTIDWLLTHVSGNNGKVGMWGVSYPGFYAAAALIDAHPALKAVSPQAPVADWFAGDDFHHNGAFFLMDAFGFFSGFGLPRPAPTATPARGMEIPMPDPYRFFLSLGTLRNADAKYFKGGIPVWKEFMSHGRFDEFWKSRSLPRQFRKVTPAVMTVGGLFDAEDLYGPLAIYQAIEARSPGSDNTLVMGPWSHGGWEGSTGESLGVIKFGSKTSIAFQEEVELPFFAHHLKGKPEPRRAEARVFQTGTNRWREYDRWPPREAREMSLFFEPGGGLTAEPRNQKMGYDEYLSDPARPVPYTARIRPWRGEEAMVEDQRFASERPDVLSYETGPLKETVTIAGPITAELYVSTTGTDADIVVKVIDVFPDTTSDPQPDGVTMGGYQMLVRAEVMRGKFRNSLERPEPFVPGKVTRVRFALRDVNHAFLPGHAMMVQVQSSWFPLVDRNPQTFVDIYNAKASDFVKARHRIYYGRGAASRIVVRKL
jgi:putative CocE/NonD family hydrolase